MEKMTWKKLAGCILGFAGIILINLGGDMSGFAWNGEGFIFMTVLSYAGSTILIKRFTGEGADPVMMSSLQFVFGGIVLTLLGLLMGGASEPVSYTHLDVYKRQCLSRAGAFQHFVVLSFQPV